jgi:hypothetical protein
MIRGTILGAHHCGWVGRIEEQKKAREKVIGGRPADGWTEAADGPAPTAYYFAGTKNISRPERILQDLRRN